MIRWQLSRLPDVRLTYNVPNKVGVELKNRLRAIARKNPLYHERVELKGLEDLSKKYGLTLGRLIFGVPGFAGVCRFHGFESQITIDLPKDPPPEMVKLLNWAVEKLAKEMGAVK